jgi:hypothetical protein
LPQLEKHVGSWCERLSRTPDRVAWFICRAATNLATIHSFWHIRRVKRWIVAVTIAIAVAIGVAAFFLLRMKPAMNAPLPNPNGHDDFAAAAQWIVPWNGDLLNGLSTEEIRAVLDQNAKALELIREGLKKESAVPLQNDQNLINSRLVTLKANKEIASLLAAEGIVHLATGRTNDAARAFAEAVVFGHAASRRGLLIDDLVGIASQSIGLHRLVPISSSISPEVRRQIINQLIDLDRKREPAATIIERDRVWSRATYGVRALWAQLATRGSLRAMDERFARNHAESVAALRLTVAELAVRGYEASLGRPPATLSDLVPEWLSQIPLDPFGNGTLIYRPLTNSFLLYSVGPDGKDDRGTPSRKRGEKAGYDLLPPPSRSH